MKTVEEQVREDIAQELNQAADYCVSGACTGRLPEVNAECAAELRVRAESVRRGTIGRRLDLKALLMELGNRLVTERRFDTPSDSAGDFSTYTILRMTEWLNRSRAAREILEQMGIDWPITEQHEKQTRISELRHEIEKAELGGRREDERRLRLELDKLLGIDTLKQDRILKLRRLLELAGERRDWAGCERIDAELRVLEGRDDTDRT